MSKYNSLCILFADCKYPENQNYMSPFDSLTADAGTDRSSLQHNVAFVWLCVMAISVILSIVIGWYYSAYGYYYTFSRMCGVGPCLPYRPERYANLLNNQNLTLKHEQYSTILTALKRELKTYLVEDGEDIIALSSLESGSRRSSTTTMNTEELDNSIDFDNFPRLPPHKPRSEMQQPSSCETADIRQQPDSTPLLASTSSEPYSVLSRSSNDGKDIMSEAYSPFPFPLVNSPPAMPSDLPPLPTSAPTTQSTSTHEMQESFSNSDDDEFEECVTNRETI